MACPKKKTSHQKQHSRRANWKAIKTTVSKCSNCSAPAKSHMVCPQCDYYRGRPAFRSDSVF
ncbi:50S ribosomal protein L32 [bacterium]|nr:50S ribosomal protein L32 [bacterium]QQR56523.1 MAG: 50S ribosomal protein L32 [Candidatus Melainabacteria bacterium]